MLPCTEEEVEALFYFIYNLYLTLYPIRTLSIPFPNFTAVHGVGVAQAKPACKHTIATRKCYQYNTSTQTYGDALKVVLGGQTTTVSLLVSIERQHWCTFIIIKHNIHCL